MHILLLAPQPFFQPRGTPIAVDLLIRSLSDMGHTLDVLVFHEGVDRDYPRVTLNRIRPPGFIRNIRPGFTFKKLVCDVYLFFAAWRLVREHQPDRVHAVEESVFVARFLHLIYGIPYVYDMDSSMPDQIVEKRPALSFLLPLLHSLIRCAARPALHVAPVCDALADTARTRYSAKAITVLRDVSMLPPRDSTPPLGLRRSLKLEGCCFMYIGNLEEYQGMGLLLQSFAKLQTPASLVVVGGEPDHVARYRAEAAALGISGRVHFLGPKPLDQMALYMDEADVLVSPRVKGTNTPMKLYSYLDSGKPVVATNLLTHTQVLNADVAMLAPAEPEAFAAAMRRLADDPALRNQLGSRGQALIRSNYTLDAFRKSLATLYPEIP